ncbi:GNAT family N-acetyltransferase [Cohnella sp.]|uniref:GNAT family N-acetyltransferase n=1 Tax=Cohnella sp. TaxID=1883426 RepID=UPI0035684F9C
MLIKLYPDDEMLHQHPFTHSEVPYNLIHLISSNERNFCLRSRDGNFIFAQTPGHNAWVWVDENVDDTEAQNLIKELIERVEDVELPGLSGEPEFIEKLASAYSLARNVSYRTDMLMESYFCLSVKPPVKVSATLIKASNEYIETIAQFCAGFACDAYGTYVEPSSQLSDAKHMVSTENLYLLFADSTPVSMANIAHRSARHARINAVYTPPENRKKGYASAAVAKLCDIVNKEGLQPMLYADMKNPDSNKVYKNIGFVESGKIADIKFSK